MLAISHVIASAAMIVITYLFQGMVKRNFTCIVFLDLFLAKQYGKPYMKPAEIAFWETIWFPIWLFRWIPRWFPTWYKFHGIMQKKKTLFYNF